MSDVAPPGNKTLVLDHASILIKLERMACEISEKHSDGVEMVICGMNERGFYIAQHLAEKILEILPDASLNLVQVLTMDHTAPQFKPQTDFNKRAVIVVDDVINTGKTLMHVLKNIFDADPASIETAFLAKREHRNYPVKADYVGVSLATTLQEHVFFDNSNPTALQVYLN